MRSSALLLMLAMCLVSWECAAKKVHQSHAQMAQIEEENAQTTTTTEEAKESEETGETTTTAKAEESDGDSEEQATTTTTENEEAEDTTTTQAGDTNEDDNEETSTIPASTNAKTPDEDQAVTINKTTQYSAKTAIKTKNAASYSSGNKIPAPASKQATSPTKSTNAKTPLNAATTPTSTTEPPKKNPTVPDSLSSNFPRAHNMWRRIEVLALHRKCLFFPVFTLVVMALIL